MTPRPAVDDRASPDDLMNLATETAGAPMQVGAVLFLATGDALDVSAATAALAARVVAAPRLRQRLDAVPFGCGRPVWVDDDRFDIAHHVQHVPCPSPRGRSAVFALAAQIIASPLDRSRPLWSATFVTGVEPDETALIIVFHHVMSDGIGGLAVLANLVDGAPLVEPAVGFPRPRPRRADLAADAWRDRARRLGRLRAAMGVARHAAADLRTARTIHAAPCSLLTPTGPHRHFEVVRHDLDAIRRVAHRHDATVNDVILFAVAAALRDFVSSRGEDVDRFVISMPVSARRETSSGDLGNQVGAVPVEIVPVDDVAAGLRATAVTTRHAKSSFSAASATALAAGFRILARLHLLRRFVDHQSMIHTFVTNLRGPDETLRFLGHEVTDVAAVSLVTGNVTVGFAVLSYSGTLTITIISDTDAAADVATLRSALEHRLDSIAGCPDGAILGSG